MIFGHFRLLCYCYSWITVSKIGLPTIPSEWNRYVSLLGASDPGIMESNAAFSSTLLWRGIKKAQEILYTFRLCRQMRIMHIFDMMPRISSCTQRCCAGTERQPRFFWNTAPISGMIWSNWRKRNQKRRSVAAYTLIVYFQVYSFDSEIIQVILQLQILKSFQHSLSSVLDVRYMIMTDYVHFRRITVAPHCYNAAHILTVQMTGSGNSEIYFFVICNQNATNSHHKQVTTLWTSTCLCYIAIYIIKGI